MVLNPKKTNDIWICFTDSIPQSPRIQIKNEEVERVKSFKLLGTTCQNDLKWNEHIDQITYKANKILYHLRQCRKSQLPTEIGLATYTSKIRPVLEYASPVWAGLPDYLQQEIERIRARSMRVLGLDRNSLTSRESHTRRLKTMKNGGSTQECMDILGCFLSGFTGNFTKQGVQKTEKLKDQSIYRLSF